MTQILTMILFAALLVRADVRTAQLQAAGVPGVQVAQDSDGWTLTCIERCDQMPGYATVDELARHFGELYEVIGYWNWLQARAAGRPYFTPLPHPNEAQPVTYLLPVGWEYVRWPAGIVRPQ